MPRCPTCGHFSGDGWNEVAHALVAADGSVRRFHPQAWRLMTLFRHSMGVAIPAARIEMALWGQCARGPDDPMRAINRLLWMIRRALEGTDYRLINSHGEGWRLEIVGQERPDAS